MSEEGILFFYNNSAKNRFASSRFGVGLSVPDKSKIYFKPLSFWEDMKDETWIISEYLGDVKHGVQTNSAPGTKAKLYSSPYFLVFKIQGVASNYLSFIDFKKPNAENTILSMLQYDDEKNALIDEYTPELILPYNSDLPLNEVLEFTLFDATNTLVQVADQSKIFIILTLLGSN
jgi:hypothetical protein